MFVDIMIRRRARLDEPSAELNARLVERFVALPGFWGEGRNAADAPFECDEVGSLDLRKSLRPGLSGQVVYRARFAGYLTKDTSQADDYMTIRLDTDQVDYAEFCAGTLPGLLTAFGSYRGYVKTDEAVRAADWEAVKQQSRKTSRDIDGRDSVFRIWPVCWFDDELARRGFGISARDAVQLAAPECERAEIVAGCAFLIVTSAIVAGANLDVLDARIQARLKAGGNAQRGAA